MLPVLPPHTLVIATSLLWRPKIHKVVIVCHGDREKVKRVQDLRAGEAYVVGDNHQDSSHNHDIGWVNQNDILARVIWPRKLS